MKKKIETSEDYWNRVDQAEREKEDQDRTPIWIMFNDEEKNDEEN